VTITDAILVLRYLFAQGKLSCLDAADANDSGGVNITDAIYLLNYLFKKGQAPATPFLKEGVDPSPDDLGCGG